MVEMKSLDGQDIYKNYQLIVFNHYIVAVEHYTDEEALCWLWAKKKSQRRFSMHYKIKEFDEISQPKQPKKSKSWIVEFKSFTHSKVDGKKSLSFRFAPSQFAEAKMFRNYFDALKEKIEYEEC